MKKFCAKVTDKNGKILTFTEEAISRELFENSLSERGYYLINIFEENQKNKILIKRRLNKNFILDFVYNIYTLLDFGLEINEILKILSDISSDSFEKEFINEIISFIKKGGKLSTALKSSKYADIFDNFFISMVSAGELTGNLNKAFNLLYMYQLNNKKIKDKLLSAIIYPILLIFMSFFVIHLLLLFIIPIIEKIYSSMNFTPSLFIKIIFKISNFITNNLIIYFVLILTITLFLIFLMYTNKINKVIKKILLKLPVISKINNINTKIKLSFSLKIFLDAGYSLDESLAKITEENKEIKKEITEALYKLKEGKSIKNAFSSIKIYEKKDLNIIEIADATSRTSSGFEKIYLDSKNLLDSYLERIFELLNPIIMIFIGFFIFFIMYLLISPTLSILENF